MNPSLVTDVGLTDAIFHRRAVREFSARETEPDSVEQLLVAAVQAPSALNQQPWGFVVIHGRTRLADYSQRVKAFLVATYPTSFEVHSRSDLYEDPHYDILHGADTLVVIYSKRGRLHPTEDCCLAAENLMLAAYGQGLGTCPIGFARPWLDLPEIKRELGVPDHWVAVFPVVLGYPAGPVAPTPREEPDVANWVWETS
ncbi:nitroreductase family protein [Horticoccus sp. 23ND18S-11]|uniref:nitroreductase family protein n=1 Tax=Horticoccus sp. 23ND18S-11 TaxID=3391832 RepID=UPI0039C8D5A5